VNWGVSLHNSVEYLGAFMKIVTAKAVPFLWTYVKLGVYCEIIQHFAADEYLGIMCYISEYDICSYVLVVHNVMS